MRIVGIKPVKKKNKGLYVKLFRIYEVTQHPSIKEIAVCDEICKAVFKENKTHHCITIDMKKFKEYLILYKED